MIGSAASSTPAPRLSVVVVVFAGGDAPDRCLASLARQAVDGGIEVIVAHDASFAASPDWVRQHPAVRVVATPAAASPARLRSLGVAATRGTIVACTEDHCVPAPDWAARIVAAHEASPGVVGGTIDKEAPASAGAWAAFLLDYSRYMPPLAAGDAEYVSDCNVSYDRADLDAVADSWRGEFHETTVHWALKERGVRLRLDPSIVVRQDRDIHFTRYLRERLGHGRVFAGTRVADASLGQRAKWSVLALPLPVVIVARVVARLAARGALRAPPAAAWPALAGSAVAWSLGELMGYVTGRGA
jgi:hypothetical protein